MKRLGCLGALFAAELALATLVSSVATIFVGMFAAFEGLPDHPAPAPVSQASMAMVMPYQKRAFVATFLTVTLVCAFVHAMVYLDVRRPSEANSESIPVITLRRHLGLLRLLLSSMFVSAWANACLTGLLSLAIPRNVFEHILCWTTVVAAFLAMWSGWHLGARWRARVARGTGVAGLAAAATALVQHELGPTVALAAFALGQVLLDDKLREGDPVGA